MIKAGLKKEFLMFLRSGRLLAVMCLVVATAVFSPVILKYTHTISGLPGMEIIKEQADATIGKNPQASIGFAEATASSTGVLLLYLILLAPAAGGETAKGTLIIPQTAGITPFGYVFPKFLLHFMLCGAFSAVGNIAAFAVSSIILPNDLSITALILAALFQWLFFGTVVFIELALGISFKMPLSAVFASIIITEAVPGWLREQHALSFSPFALMSFVYSAATGKPHISTGNVIISILFSFVIMSVSVLVATIAQKAEIIEN
jgi:hypothetical protein